MFHSRPRMLIVVWVAVMMALLLVASSKPAMAAPRGSGNFETTREEVLASRRRRAKQLEEMLDDARQRLVDHTRGHRFLGETELTDLEKKISIYQRKLDTMRTDLDDREVDRIIKREKLRDERLKERRAQRSEL